MRLKADKTILKASKYLYGHFPIQKVIILSRRGFKRITQQNNNKAVE